MKLWATHFVGYSAFEFCEKHHFWEGGRYVFSNSTKTADASFKTVTEFQKMKADCTIVWSVCMCMERNGTDILHSLIPVDSSHLSLQFCLFLKKVQLCAHSWVFYY